MVLCFSDSRRALLQFHRFSNCYFLVIAALASIPSISPVGGLTFWFPLITVLFLTALKDGNKSCIANPESNNAPKTLSRVP